MNIFNKKSIQINVVNIIDYGKSFKQYKYDEQCFCIPKTDDGVKLAQVLVIAYWVITLLILALGSINLCRCSIQTRGIIRVIIIAVVGGMVTMIRIAHIAQMITIAIGSCFTACFNCN
eukprot:132360_1